MMHVKEIRELVEQGKTSDAHDAIDLLLELGPHNTEALKLRALLYGQQGRFPEETKCWERVIDIDCEDEDAITFFRMRHLEDREHFYFTDDLPDGGRRFIAYPKSLVKNTFYALIGCLTFLIFTRLSLYFPTLEKPEVLLPVFVVSVLFPWVGTLIAWIKAIRSVSLTRSRFEVATRFKTHFLEWKDVDSVYIAHQSTDDEDFLSLIIMPNSKNLHPIEIDLSVESSSIRARTFLVKEVRALFGEPVHTSRCQLKIDEQNVISF